MVIKFNSRQISYFNFEGGCFATVKCFFSYSNNNYKRDLFVLIGREV